MKISNYVAKCITALWMGAEVRRATVFVSARCTVKATRQRRVDRRCRGETFIVTVGRPNFRERQWLRVAKAAGEPCPVRRVQLTGWPRKKCAPRS